jgi:hypothetical protein
VNAPVRSRSEHKPDDSRRKTSCDAAASFDPLRTFGGAADAADPALDAVPKAGRTVAGKKLIDGFG